MSLCCRQDDRRDAVRAMQGRVGLDYVEVDEERQQLSVHFLGKLPPELAENKPGIERHLRLEGGQRIRDIRIVDVDPVVDPDELSDDHLVVRLDRLGDFSTYTLRLAGVDHVDPRYDHLDFSFHLDCPRDLDCAPVCPCGPPVLAEPAIDYLAKDYASFRRLILDRLAILLPGWSERHVPDIGIALVELLAYAGDYLSYHQDAVATEAYLDTARRRISVRRHVRLVDYRLHEGCNARALVCVQVSAGLSLDPARTAFVTGLDEVLGSHPTVLEWDDLRDVPPNAYDVFEPMRRQTIHLRPAHNEIRFYTWGDRECCLERGSTSATLLDTWVGTPAPTGEAAAAVAAVAAGSPRCTDPTRALQLEPGDLLVIEEVIGPETAVPADADPTHRHPVRLTRVTRREDPVVRTADDRPTPYVEVEWGPADALPFPVCICTIGPSPDCRFLDGVSVARGNVVLVDHGRTTGPEDLGGVPTLRTEALCLCADHPGDVRTVAGAHEMHLGSVPLTFRQPLPADRNAAGRRVAAARLMHQDVRAAVPQVRLVSEPPQRWRPRYDLLASGGGDPHFVVEIDDEGVANLRLGDGELGMQPTAGTAFSARYRVGNGTSGNVGAEAICHLVLDGHRRSGLTVTVRNPLPAAGGTDAEPTADAKLFAPHAASGSSGRSPPPTTARSPSATPRCSGPLPRCAGPGAGTRRTSPSTPSAPF
jgi:hypothetical protein